MLRPKLSPQARRAIDRAAGTARAMGKRQVETADLLQSLLAERPGGVEPRSGGVSPLPTTRSAPEGGARLLERFCRDLTAQARLGQLDPVVGREEELSRVVQILARKTKNNPVLLGEPGVGKTAVAEALAQALSRGEVPETLRGRRLLRLDLAALVAGTKYRGEFEERVRDLVAELHRRGDTILFLDEIHTLVGAGSAEGAIDAANLLKPALGRGELQVVGATTWEEFRRYIQKDAALERRFQPVAVEEPTAEETRRILKGLRAGYERFHGLTIPPEALEAAVELGERYLPQRRFPDKAVDLMDEAAALARMRGENEVSAQTVARVVSVWTGVPAGELTAGESARLGRLEEELSRGVIGQPEAVRAVARGVRRSRLGLRDPGRPAGCFLFLGPTGVGKTQLCRALARWMFGTERALLRFDMSEYTDPHSAARLVGAPPGYVGFEEGGQLVSRVRRQPYSLILFDEMEKAHPQVANLLLQIMEEGCLTDGRGDRADFRNTMVVMTSNLGSHRAVGPVGFAPEGKDAARRRALEAARGFFRPEFLGRLDEIAVFHPLGREELQQIAGGLLEESAARLARRGITLEGREALAQELARLALEERDGARSLRRLIARLVEDRAAEELLAGKIFPGDGFWVEHFPGSFVS